MADLTTQRIMLTGIEPVLQAAAVGGDTAQPGDNIFLVVNNAGGTACNVTVAVPGDTNYGVPNPDITVQVPVGQERWIGLRGEFANTDNRVDISYDQVASVTVGAFAI